VTDHSPLLGRVLVAAAALITCGCSQSRPTVQSPPSPSPTSPTSGRPPAPFTTASAIIRDLAGGRVGMVNFTDTYSGVLVVANVSGLGLGAHGLHMHAIGKCDPPFTTAGPHFNPAGKHHGFQSPDGPHLGDLPNIDTPAAGQLRFEFLLPGVSLKGTNALLDADGASIVIHAARDDYKTDPAGDSGSRIACGVLIPR
jgi:Cu-Zn family superoxide dismutase